MSQNRKILEKKPIKLRASAFREIFLENAFLGYENLRAEAEIPQDLREILRFCFLSNF
jgi:hypothetical protein